MQPKLRSSVRWPWFTNISVHQSHLEGLFKLFLGPTLCLKFNIYRTSSSPPYYFIPSSISWLFHFLCNLHWSTHYLSSFRLITLLQNFLKTFANSLLRADGLKILQPIPASDSSPCLKILLWIQSLYSVGFPFLLPPPCGSGVILIWDSHDHFIGSLYLPLKKNTVIGVRQTLIGSYLVLGRFDQALNLIVLTGESWEMIMRLL